MFFWSSQTLPRMLAQAKRLMIDYGSPISTTLEVEQLFFKEHFNTPFSHLPLEKIKIILDLWLSDITVPDDRFWDDLTVILYYGYYYHIVKDQPIVVKYYRRAIELGDDQALDYLSKYYYRIEDLDGLIECAENSLDKGIIEPIDRLAFHYDTIKDRQSAIKWYQVGTNLGVNQHIYRLGTIYMEQGDVDKALDYWRLGSSKDCESCLESLANYYWPRELKLTIKHYRRLIDLSPDRDIYLDNYLDIYFDLFTADKYRHLLRADQAEEYLDKIKQFLDKEIIELVIPESELLNLVLTILDLNTRLLTK